MEKQPEETNEEEIARQNGVTPLVSGKMVQFGPGVAARVSAEQDVAMTRSMAVVVAAGQDMEMKQSRAQMVAVGRDMKVTDGSTLIASVGNDIKSENSFNMLLNASGNVDLVDCLTPVLVGSQVTAGKSVIGLVLSRQTNLGDGSQVLLNTPQAVALGACFGVVFAVVSWLLKRK